MKRNSLSKFKNFTRELLTKIFYRKLATRIVSCQLIEDMLLNGIISSVSLKVKIDELETELKESKFLSYVEETENNNK